MKCSQCNRPAIVRYGALGLCVEHHLKMQQATYLQVSMLAANLNFLQTKISAGTGGLASWVSSEVSLVPRAMRQSSCLIRVEMGDTT